MFIVIIKIIKCLEIILVLLFNIIKIIFHEKFFKFDF